MRLEGSLKGEIAWKKQGDRKIARDGSYLVSFNKKMETCKSRIGNLLEEEEKYWKQCSREDWLALGDQNTHMVPFRLQSLMEFMHFSTNRIGTSCKSPNFGWVIDDELVGYFSGMNAISKHKFWRVFTRWGEVITLHKGPVSANPVP